jgi:hypothetical protein
MINLGREIRPEDFAHDPTKGFCGDEWEIREKLEKYNSERAELKRLYEIQEENKARAKYKIEQARKDKIPYSNALAMEICGRISAGQFLINICNDEDMPIVRNVNQWLKDHIDFKALYNDAINDRLNIFEDQLCTIADSAENDFKIVNKNGKVSKVLDAEVISRAKLRIDARRAHLKAYRPEKWGEQSTLITKSVDDMSELSAEEIEKVIADLETKNAVVKQKSVAA